MISGLYVEMVASVIHLYLSTKYLPIHLNTYLSTCLNTVVVPMSIYCLSLLEIQQLKDNIVSPSTAYSY